MRLKFAVLFSCLTLMLWAQTYPAGFLARYPPSTSWHILPQLVPGAPTDLVAQDVYVCYMDVNNKTAGAITLTILDKQGTPVPFMSAVSIPANTLNANILNSGGGGGGCRYFPGGINWSASAANSLSVYMTGRF